MRSPRRIAVLILAYAVLGAATTVGVSWAFALSGFILPDPNPDDSEVIGPTGLAIVVEDPITVRGISLRRSWTRQDILSTMADAEGGSDTRDLKRLRHPPDDRTLPTELGTLREELWYGWPLRAMRASIVYGASDPDDEFQSTLWVIRPKGMLKGPPFYWWNGTPRHDGRAVPTGILARGFALNTAFYAAAWWTLLVGISRVRAWNRRRRGLCVKCTYDLRGIEPHAPCPECGKGRVPS